MAGVHDDGGDPKEAGIRGRGLFNRGKEDPFRQGDKAFREIKGTLGQIREGNGVKILPIQEKEALFPGFSHLKGKAVGGCTENSGPQEGIPAEFGDSRLSLGGGSPLVSPSQEGQGIVQGKNSPRGIPQVFHPPQGRKAKEDQEGKEKSCFSKLDHESPRAKTADPVLPL
jgi:hypothetical protein